MTDNNFDLNSYGELEKFLYGGNDSISYFNKEIKKCTPFTQQSVEMTKYNGTPNFGYTWSVSISKEGDYLVYVWLLLEIPRVELKKDNSIGDSARIRWTENLMHNIIANCTLTLNDRVITRLDSFILDLQMEFNTSGNKYAELSKSIGNIPDLISPSRLLPSKTLILPLRLFITKDSGNALPIRALRHSEIQVNFDFRSWESLLIMEDSASANPNLMVPFPGKDILEVPQIKQAKLYCNYTIVSPEERAKIGLRTKFMLVEQIQTSPRQMIADEEKVSIDLMFKHSTRILWFAFKNTTYKNSGSNYSFGNPHYKGTYFFPNNHNSNPIKDVEIVYNNNSRVSKMFIEYFKFVQGWFHFDRVPTKPLYAFSYSLNERSSSPNGSVSLSKIDNPRIILTLDDQTREAIRVNNESFELNVAAVNYNVMMIKDGLASFVS